MADDGLEDGPERLNEMNHGHLPHETEEYYEAETAVLPRCGNELGGMLTATASETHTAGQSTTTHYFQNVIPELEIYHAGELTVLGFGGREIVDQLNFAQCSEEFMNLVRDYQCQTLALDMTGVRLIPSGLLGVLVTVHLQQIDIHLFNPSRDIREVLEITKLDRVWHLHEIDV